MRAVRWLVRLVLGPSTEPNALHTVIRANPAEMTEAECDRYRSVHIPRQRKR